jgi:hypothetical protein
MSNTISTPPTNPEAAALDLLVRSAEPATARTAFRGP